MAERVGVLTGGGDCPGLNAVIRGIVRKSQKAYGYEIVGIRQGWRGLLDMDYELLTRDRISGILHRGGTILGTSRTNPFKIEGGPQKILDNFKKLKLSALIAIGGEDTLGVANKLVGQGLNAVGVPKTIDNDLDGTDFTFGFDTAVNIAMEAIDRVHTTAESHNRIIVVEVMGRHAGWIAMHSGIAGGADVILIPEKPFDIDAVCDVLNKRREGGRKFSIVVAAEGAKFKPSGRGEDALVTLEAEKDQFGHVRLGGIGNALAGEIEKRTGFETRAVVLGHIQRGGSPTAYDRVLATRFGVAAIDLVHEKRFGHMVALRGNDIVSIPIADAVAKLKTVPDEFYNVAEVFFG